MVNFSPCVAIQNKYKHFAPLDMVGQHIIQLKYTEGFMVLPTHWRCFGDLPLSNHQASSQLLEGC